MKLNLKKPIVFFDLETTGINVAKDRIVQIGYIKIMPNGQEVCGDYLVNPEMHIPEETSAIHHITDDMVKDAPTFKQLAGKLEQEFLGCDFAGYNSNRFDVPMLVEEFLRVGKCLDLKNAKFVDVQNIFYKKEPRTLIAAYKYYCNKNLEGAHAADADIRATYEVLQAQLDRYANDETDPVQNDITWLAEYTRMNRNADPMGAFAYDDNNQIIFNFGKHKGQLVSDVLQREPGYYDWMINGDFALSTKQCLTAIKLSMFKR